MADPIDENVFGKELAAAFEADEVAAQPPVAPVAPVEPVTPPADPAAPKVEEPKNDPAAPVETPKVEEPVAPADPAEPPKEDPAAPEAPKTEEQPTEPKPLTQADLTEAIRKIQTDERISSQDISTAIKDVTEAYYPDGLSNVLIDQTTQKELRTPQDVVDAARASGDEMSMEAAAQWLLNEQFKLDNSISDIKKGVERIAETTINFKRDSLAVLQKYAPLFEKYPQIQAKVHDKLMKQVKADLTKNVILSAPDVMEYYDDYLEPYQQAYEFSTHQPATNPVAPVEPPKPTPTAADRMDEGGDGGASPVDDPNDFAQQVAKELSY